jgi:hypothetical protein
MNRPAVKALFDDNNNNDNDLANIQGFAGQRNKMNAQIA